MSDQQYASVVGFVQFDPEQKEVNGQTILNFSVRAVGWTGQPLVQVTLWSEYADAFDSIVRGSFVAVDGKYKQNGQYHNISASKLAFVDEVVKAERTDAPSRTAAPSASGGAF